MASDRLLEFRLSARLLRETRREAAAPTDRAGQAAPDKGAPLLRKLRVFTVDPTQMGDEGAIVALDVPYESLEYMKPGNGGASQAGNGWLRGNRFLVSGPAKDKSTDVLSQRLIAGFEKLNLDDLKCQTECGYAPSLSDPCFIAQMVYAVAMSLDGMFTRALGRKPMLDLERKEFSRETAGRLIIDPWNRIGPQAWYDRNEGAVHFGRFAAAAHARGYPPGSQMFTALSHDVIVHELSHAYLDSVRPHFTAAVNPDALAFHEAFADLMVIFQRCSYPELVHQQMGKARGEVSAALLLATMATGFSRTAGIGDTLRQLDGESQLDLAGDEPHERGAVLVQAVYRAFRSVAGKRIDRVLAIATGGSGILPKGNLAPALLDEIARQLRKSAQIFQSMLIRALDYCPPFGMEFGDFLRAVIVADKRLVPNDDDGVRLAWMEAFRLHGIFPGNGMHLSEDSLSEGLLTPADVPVMDELSFASTGFSSDPGEPLSLRKVIQQGSSVANAFADERWQALFLSSVPPDGASLPVFSVEETNGNRKPIEIISIRSFARPGPNGMTEFGTVVELVQKLDHRDDDSGYFAGGGATLLFDSTGRLCAGAIRRANDVKLVDIALLFSESRMGKRVWEKDSSGKRRLQAEHLKRLCVAN